MDKIIYISYCGHWIWLENFCVLADYLCVVCVSHILLIKLNLVRTKKKMPLTKAADYLIIIIIKVD